MVVMSNLLGPQTSSQKRGTSMVEIVALMPTAARFAWMIGAIDTMAGKDETMVMEVSNPLGRPASANKALAFATLPRGVKALMSAKAQFHFGMTPPRMGVAWPKKVPATMACRSSAWAIAWRTLGLSRCSLVLLGSNQ